MKGAYFFQNYFRRSQGQKSLNTLAFSSFFFQFLLSYTLYTPSTRYFSQLPLTME